MATARATLQFPAEAEARDREHAALAGIYPRILKALRRRSGQRADVTDSAATAELRFFVDLDFKANVKQILRKLAEAMREHIDSVNDPYALQQISEAEEMIEEI